ncbi:glycosyltransferase [Arcticibacter tournemirensis]|uniref:Glycosyltransferase family 1 protein n=2 Tax=Pseudomonadati TaxID=3379134 RepID=A0A4Q0M8G7_9SPHI|nr:glycosyltransferase [Arcticibacter tournemirensis]RXF69440.1 glycosyltransferase family 1 protein [Arcticibacter tournemirensis]
MKMVFICGSLEPGCDGVGDYVRRLAIDMIRKGHEIGAIALNDRYVTSSFNGCQTSEGFKLPVFRLPSTHREGKRIKEALRWLNDINPQFLSLQFVPFSFQSKGLPGMLSHILSKIGKGRRWHIMFHELWVGMDVESSKKHVYWGLVQKQLIRLLVKKLKPVLVHTQTKLYQEQLSKMGIPAFYLPLFSNIPVSEQKMIACIEKREVSMVVFGAIHPGAPVELLVKEACQYSKQKGTPVSLTLVGNCGAEQNKWVNVWQSENLPVKVMGGQPASKISEILSGSTLGISTTVTALVEKSGSVAAMRAHKLPVLCVSREWQPRGFGRPVIPPGIIEFTPGILDGCLSSKAALPAGYNVSEVSKIFEEHFISVE